MSLQTEISSCQGKQASTLGNDLNTNNSIVFMKGIMRAELMVRQNEMLGLTSRRKVSTCKYESIIHTSSN